MLYQSIITVCFVVHVVTSSSLLEKFMQEIPPVSPDEPHHFNHTMHLSTGLGRSSHFSYDATKHPLVIAPHYGKGAKVTACTQTTVTIAVAAEQVVDADLWTVGWKFTTHAEHFACPNPHDGSVSKSPAYREVTAVSSSIADSESGEKIYVLTTKAAAFADFFDKLTMKMHTAHMLHDNPNQVAAGERRLLQPEKPVRRLISERDLEPKRARRRLHGHRRRRWFKKAAKWVKKKIIQPAEAVIKAVVTGKADKTWTKDFSMNWNYDKETGGALKSLPIHGQTACTSCFFHADAGYKVEIDVEHYHLESILAEVYGDVQLELAMTNSGPAVDVKKLDTVFSAELFSVTFSIGPVPVTVSMNLDVDLGLHFTVQEIGASPHIHAQGNGHIRFGKQYKRSSGWSPVNSHTLDLSFDSAGGTVKADLLLYANIVPKIELHHIGSASVTITPALDVSLTAALPKADCDFKPLEQKHPVCEASEGTDQHCALGLTITPTINVELDMDLDIELFSKSLYKHKFAPMQLLQKTFTIPGFPKCLIGSWSKSSQRRRTLLSILSGGVTSKTTKGRLLEENTVTGQSIRDPNLADPRNYLMNEARNTPCKNDCNGNGFCVNATAAGYACLCQQGWSGESCLAPVIEVDSGSGVSVKSGGDHPQPKLCGHGTVLNVKTSPEAKFLGVCQGRTSEFFCASGNETEMKTMDEAIRSTLLSYAESGYPCTSAMAELQCRLTFPAVVSTTNQRILPIAHESCVDLFTPCLGDFVAGEICSNACADGINQGYAGVSAESSPWGTTEIPTLYEAEYVAEQIHTKCTVAPSSLVGCPERGSKPVHINTDVFNSITEMDQYVLNQVKVMAGNSTACQNAYRLNLCQSTMPLCNKNGNPIKMSWKDCVNHYSSCPDLIPKDRSFYGLPDDDSEGTTLNFAKAICNDQSDFFTRSNVGKHAAICGMEPMMLNADAAVAAESMEPSAVPDESLPWHQNIGIVGPVFALVGLLVGVAVMAVVAVIVQKNKVKNHATTPTKISVDSDSSALRNNAAELGHYTQESMTNVAFPSNAEDMQSINPMVDDEE